MQAGAARDPLTMLARSCLRRATASITADGNAQDEPQEIRKYEIKDETPNWDTTRVGLHW